MAALICSLRFQQGLVKRAAILGSQRPIYNKKFWALYSLWESAWRKITSKESKFFSFFFVYFGLRRSE